MKLVIAGPVKNCEKHLQKNLKFIDSLINLSIFESLSVFIMESDSIDGSKSILNNYENNKNFKIFYENGLDTKIPERVKRIAYCRVYLIEKIISSKVEFEYYIPLDLDVDLFSDIKPQVFDLVTELDEDKQVDAYFQIQYLIITT